MNKKNIFQNLNNILNTILHEKKYEYDIYTRIIQTNVKPFKKQLKPKQNANNLLSTERISNFMLPTTTSFEKVQV